MLPALLKDPEKLLAPLAVHFKGEAKAPAVFELDQLILSASNSASVGSRQPLGQGLLVPLVPCHKLLF